MIPANPTIPPTCACPDDGTCSHYDESGTVSHENAGHAPGSYESSARAFTYAAIGLIVTILGALVCAWVRA